MTDNELLTRAWQCAELIESGRHSGECLRKLREYERACRAELTRRHHGGQPRPLAIAISLGASVLAAVAATVDTLLAGGVP